VALKGAARYRQYSTTVNTLVEFDHAYYRASNPDLAGFSDSELEAHFRRPTWFTVCAS
jgi:hypothetical protein